MVHRSHEATGRTPSFGRAKEPGTSEAQANGDEVHISVLSLTHTRVHTYTDTHTRDSTGTEV